MKVTEQLRNNLKDFFKQDFKITDINSGTIEKAVLVTLKFISLKEPVFVVCDLDFNIRYIL